MSSEKIEAINKEFEAAMTSKWRDISELERHFLSTALQKSSNSKLSRRSQPSFNETLAQEHARRIEKEVKQK